MPRKNIVALPERLMALGSVSDRMRLIGAKIFLQQASSKLAEDPSAPASPRLNLDDDHRTPKSWPNGGGQSMAGGKVLVGLANSASHEIEIERIMVLKKSYDVLFMLDNACPCAICRSA